MSREFALANGPSLEALGFRQDYILGLTFLPPPPSRQTAVDHLRSLTREYFCPYPPLSSRRMFRSTLASVPACQALQGQ